MKNQQELLSQAQSIIRMGEKVLTTESSDHRLTPLVNEQQFHDFRISALSFLSRVFGESGIHCQSLKNEVTHPTASRTKRAIGILTAACRDLQGDWLENTTRAISRDILGDILLLARGHAEQGQLVAAATVAGTVLEKQLRQLSQSQAIPLYNEGQSRATAKKGPQLAGEIYKKRVFSRQEYKSIIAWLDMYDQAVAGTLPPAGKVKEMLSGIQLLLAKGHEESRSQPGKKPQ